jgi:hypothetical protein
MKQITVIVTCQVQVGTTAVSVTTATDLSAQARRNKAKVIEGALSVEHELVSMISYYFFGGSHEKKPTFDSLILNSDSCSFAAKRRLMAHIINEQSLLDGTRKNDFEKLLQRVMSFRNAFTHGSLSSDGATVCLSYFEGGPRKHELTDEFLTDVETTLRTAWEECCALARKMGVTKNPREQDGP